MKVLFLTLIDLKTYTDSGIYQNLLSEFIAHNDDIYAVSPIERRNNKETYLFEDKNWHLLKVKTLNILKCNFLEKGISTLLIQNQFKSAIDYYFKNIHFDLILYSTPPITFFSVVSYFKERDNAFTYLLLKDIFPQNAVDLGIISKLNPLYWYFRKKERNLYKVSDCIGCMSPANVRYLLDHNHEVRQDKIEVNPNSITIEDFKDIDEVVSINIRKKFNLPTDKKILVYGGNLGKPQGISYIIECLKAISNIHTLYILIVGSGTEYKKLQEYYNKHQSGNLKLIPSLPKDEFETLISACDIGLVFLDYRFTIPNYPSRMLSYMKMGLPILASTDPNTDFGEFLEQNEIGMSCLGNNPSIFVEKAKEISSRIYSKEKIRKVLKENFSVTYSYNLIKARYNANCCQ